MHARVWRCMGIGEVTFGCPLHYPSELGDARYRQYCHAAHAGCCQIKQEHTCYNSTLAQRHGCAVRSACQGQAHVHQNPQQQGPSSRPVIRTSPGPNMSHRNIRTCEGGSLEIKPPSPASEQAPICRYHFSSTTLLCFFWNWAQTVSAWRKR
jgi:hypothetical protein